MCRGVLGAVLQQASDSSEAVQARLLQHLVYMSVMVC